MPMRALQSSAGSLRLACSVNGRTLRPVAEIDGGGARAGLLQEPSWHLGRPSMGVGCWCPGREPWMSAATSIGLT